MFMFRQIFARLREVGDRLEDIERSFEAHDESQKIDFHSLEKRLIELVEGKETNITGKIANDVEKRLIEFHKEIMDKINTDTCFDVYSDKINTFEVLYDKRLDNLEQRLNNLVEGNVGLIEKEILCRIEPIVARVDNSVEKRLIEFHKEIMDKYFQTLEKILHFGKEISVIDSLAHRVNDQDLENLKRTIMQPIIEARYKEEANKVDDRVKSFGNEILNRRKELHETMIKKERQEEDVTNLKEQITLLDWVIGVKHE